MESELISAGLGLAGGLFGAYMLHQKLDGAALSEIDSLKQRLERHLNGENSAKGGVKYQEAQEDIAAAAVEALNALNGGKKVEDVLKSTAIAHPKAVEALAKRGLKLL